MTMVLVLINPALAYTGSAQAAFAIRGTVVTTAGIPCALCRVTLDTRGARTTITDSAGNFNFVNVEPGTYVIAASGYEDAQQTVKVDAGGLQSIEPFVKIVIRSTPAPAARPQPATVDTSALRIYPRKAVDLYKKALKDRSDGKIEQGVQKFEEAIRLAPDYFSAHVELGISYQRLGRLDDAESEFLTAQRINRSSAEPLIHLSALYLLRNQLVRAAEASVDAIHRDPRSADAYFNLGLALYCASNFELAEGAVKNAIELSSSPAQARWLLANIYLRLQSPPKALDQLESLLKTKPTAGQFNLATTLRNRLLQGDQPSKDFDFSFQTQIAGGAHFYSCPK
jgi:hypothetical protein